MGHGLNDLLLSLFSRHVCGKCKADLDRIETCDRDEFGRRHSVGAEMVPFPLTGLKGVRFT